MYKAIDDPTIREMVSATTPSNSRKAITEIFWRLSNDGPHRRTPTACMAIVVSRIGVG